MRHRLSNAEQIISEIKTVNPLSAYCWIFQKHQDNCLYRTNLYLMGLPEYSEGHNPEIFIKNWIKSKIGDNRLSALLPIQQAHGSLCKLGPQKLYPDLFTPKILHFRDMESMLCGTWNLDKLKYNNCVHYVHWWLLPQLNNAAKATKCSCGLLL